MKLLNICPLCHRGFIGDENRRENGDQPFVKSTIPILNAEQSEEVLKDQDSFADFIKVGFEICEHPCYDCKEIAEKKFKRIMNYFEELCLFGLFINEGSNAERLQRLIRRRAFERETRQYTSIVSICKLNKYEFVFLPVNYDFPEIGALFIPDDKIIRTVT